MKKSIYVVTMYRWGNRENHSYVTWAGTSRKRAFKESDDEEMERGGKYEAEIVEFTGTIFKRVNDIFDE